MYGKLKQPLSWLGPREFIQAIGTWVRAKRCMSQIGHGSYLNLCFQLDAITEPDRCTWIYEMWDVLYILYEEHSKEARSSERFFISNNLHKQTATYRAAVYHMNHTVSYTRPPLMHRMSTINQNTSLHSLIHIWRHVVYFAVCRWDLWSAWNLTELYISNNAYIQFPCHIIYFGLICFGYDCHVLFLISSFSKFELVWNIN